METLRRSDATPCRGALLLLLLMQITDTSRRTVSSSQRSSHQVGKHLDRLLSFRFVIFTKLTSIFGAIKLDRSVKWAPSLTMFLLLYGLTSTSTTAISLGTIMPKIGLRQFTHLSVKYVVSIVFAFLLFAEFYVRIARAF